MGANAVVGHCQVVGGGQALLFRTILGVGLYLLAKDVADNGGNNLVGGYRAKAADRMAAHRETTLRPDIGVFLDRQRQRMADAGDKEALTGALGHVAGNGDEIARPHITRAQPGRSGVDLGNAVHGRIVVVTRQGVGESGLDFARQGVGLGQGVVHPLHDADGSHVFEGVDNVGAGEGAEAGDVDRADLNTQVRAYPVDAGFGRVD